MIDWREAMPLAAFLGVEPVAAAPDEVRARLAWRAELCTAGGVLHGGALMALADSAGGVCAVLNLPDGATATATPVEHGFPPRGPRGIRGGGEPAAPGR